MRKQWMRSQKRRVIMKRVLVSSLSLLLSVAVAAQTRRRSGREIPPSMTSRQIAETVSKSLVLISTQDGDGDPLAQASGFFFKPGLVATNLHVLKRASHDSIDILD